MRISDWSSDVCSSDLHALHVIFEFGFLRALVIARRVLGRDDDGGGGGGLAVFEAERDLALRVRLQEGGAAAVAGGGHLRHYLVAVVQRCGTEVGRLVAKSA